MHMFRSHHMLDMLDCHLDHSSDIFEKDLGHCLTSLPKVRRFLLAGLEQDLPSAQESMVESCKDSRYFGTAVGNLLVS